VAITFSPYFWETFFFLEKKKITFIQVNTLKKKEKNEQTVFVETSDVCANKIIIIKINCPFIFVNK